MSIKPLVHQDPFPLAHDDTEYCLFNKEYVSVAEFDGQPVLKIESQTLTLLTRQASHNAAFMLRVSHQQQVASILLDPEASENDKYAALQFLRNSEIVAKGILPTCQNIGTAIITGKKSQRIWTGGGDEAVLAQGVYNTYTEDNLRYPQNAPLDMHKEVSTGTNLPAQINPYSVDGEECKFLCVAKGGGSISKTYLYQGTKALITPAGLKNCLVEKVRTLDTVACSPYHIAPVIGSALTEATLRTAKLASTRYYDDLPIEGSEHGQVFRDVQLEQELLQETQNLGLGMQFGGKYFAHDIRVTRLLRYGASYPIGIGVSRPADRNIRAKIDHDGIWIGKLKDGPGEYIPKHLHQQGEDNVVSINLNQLMNEIPAQLLTHPVSTRLSLSGTITVARDITHAELKELIDNGEALSQHVKDHSIYYAGLAKAPTGYAPGSLGPTTAGCMDSYVDLLQPHGTSIVMLTKGNRSRQVTDVCHKHGGFYLGSIDGPAAVLAQQSIKSLKCVVYPELGMEAIWKIEVEDFSVSILADDRGDDFFQQIQSKQCAGCQQYG